MTTREASMEAMWEAFTGYQHTAALKTAVELDLFTAIGEGATRLPALAKRTGASERGLRALLNHLAVGGFLTREGDAYALTATTAAFCDRRSPAFLASAATFITSPAIVEGFTRLTEAVRRGGTAVPEDVTTASHPAWVEFARSMAPLARATAGAVVGQLEVARSGAVKVLDIAAGHGMFGIAFAREDPQATVTGLDWAIVLEVAKENAAAAGVADRYRTIAGSAFEVDWGTGYDLVLLPNFLHHFDVPSCVRVLEKTAAALAHGGHVVIVEFVPDDDRSGPPEAVRFALTMLAGTPGGDAYTFAEYRDMLAKARLVDPVMRDLAPLPQRMIVARRA
jgi:SAM-dependent methyltransferase